MVLNVWLVPYFSHIIPMRPTALFQSIEVKCSLMCGSVFTEAISQNQAQYPSALEDKVLQANPHSHPKQVYTRKYQKCAFKTREQEKLVLVSSSPWGIIVNNLVISIPH